MSRTPRPGRVDQRVDDLVREAVGIGAQRRRRDDAHELPVAGDRVLARAERVQAAVEDRVGGGRDARERQHGAEPERAEHRQVEPAGRLGDVAERVRAGVAVVGGVGQLPRAARVQHDDEGPAVHPPDSGRARVSPSGDPRRDACRAGSWRRRRGRASPAASAGRSRPRAGAWRRCGAACAGSSCSRARPPRRSAGRSCRGPGASARCRGG